MECRTGDLVIVDDDPAEEIENRLGQLKVMQEQHLAPVSKEDVPKVKKMNKDRRKNWMRNKPCPCGSNKKFKKCCWSKYI